MLWERGVAESRFLSLHPAETALVAVFRIVCSPLFGMWFLLPDAWTPSVNYGLLTGRD